MIARVSSLLAFVAVLCVAPLASADKPQAEEHYKRGHIAFNLGRFQEAIREWEQAFEQDPDPEYLHSLAQAHRQLNNYERAVFFYKRYLLLDPNTPRKANVEKLLVEIEKARDDQKKKLDEQLALQKKRDDEIARKKADDELALKKKRDAEIAAGIHKRVRISVEAGLSIIHLRGVEADPRAPSLGGRIAVSWIRRIHGFTFDLGGLWQITTIPYDEDLGIVDGMARVKQSAVFMTQLHGTASVLHTLVGPVWGRASIGLGLSGFGNLKDGNPVTDDGDPLTMDGGPDVRAPCARLDTAVGYRYSPTIDFVLGLASGSISAKAREAPNLGRVVTFETAILGVYIKI